MRCRKTPLCFGVINVKKNFLNKDYYEKMYNDPENYVFFNGQPFIQKEEVKSKLINKYKNILNKNIKKQDAFLKELNNLLDKKIGENEKKEKALAKSFVKEYPEDEKEQVRFWTNFFNTISKEEIKIGEKRGIEQEDITWLRTIFSSQEFAKKLASHKAYSTFSKTKLKGDKETEDLKEQLLSDFSKASAIVDFEKILNKEGFDNDLYQAIDEIIEKTIGQTRIYIRQHNEKIFKDFKIQVNSWDNLKKSIKKWGEFVVKDVIKKIKNSKSIDENKKSKIIEELQEIQVKHENANEIYWEINITEQSGVLSIYGLKEIKDNFYLAAGSIIGDLFNNKDNVTFHIGGGQEIILKKKEKFEVSALLAHDKEIRGKNVVIKSMYEANVYGFLGEYLRLYSPINIKLTGSDFNTYVDTQTNKKFTVGESFSDAFFETELEGKKERIGLNIKHYVSKFNKNSITFYKKDEVSLLSPYIRRYFSENETKELRFLDINYNFFKEKLNADNINDDNLIERYTQSAYNNLSRFARIESGIENESTNYSNLFFVINNMYIPTSYIYKKIKESLNEDNKKYFSIDFKPRSIQPIPQKEDDNLISRWSNSHTTSSKIIFEGLTVKGLMEFFK